MTVVYSPSDNSQFSLKIPLDQITKTFTNPLSTFKIVKLAHYIENRFQLYIFAYGFACMSVHAPALFVLMVVHSSEQVEQQFLHRGRDVWNCIVVFPVNKNNLFYTNTF